MIFGTFAWTNFNARTMSVFRGVGSSVNPGATLHYDFDPDGSNKDIYIENWGTEDLFVRVRLKEYMELGSGAGLKAVYDPETGESVSNPQNSAQSLISGANINDTNTWEIHFPKENAPNESVGDLGFRKYWQWNMGGQKYYFPADETERENMEFISEHSPAGLTATCVNDYGVQTKLTRYAQVLTMAQWVSDGSNVGDYWVIDTDGWAYWASPLEPGDATGLLLNGVTRVEYPELDYYYGVFAEAQMATRTGAQIDGFLNNYERFGDDERGGWTTYGQALVEKIVYDTHSSVSVGDIDTEMILRETQIEQEIEITLDGIIIHSELETEDVIVLAQLTEQNVPQILVQYESLDEAQATLNSVMSYSRELSSDTELSHAQPIFTVENTIDNFNLDSIRVPDESNIHKVMALFELDSNVRVVEPNFPVYLASVPSNRLFDQQWALINTGQIAVDVRGNGWVGTPGFDINIYPVYRANLNFSEVIVAVIDGGLDETHPDFRQVMLPGRDITLDSPFVDESQCTGHGTSVTSIIAGVWNDAEVAGVAPNARIIPIRVFRNGDSTAEFLFEGLDFAIRNGAAIINCSWTTQRDSNMLRNVITDNPDILFVGSSGNQTSSERFYPAALDLPNVIGVGAINNRGEMASFSNFGPHVCFAAPGEGLMAISGGRETPMGMPGPFSGTSASAPVVSGAAALYLGLFPDASPAEVRAALINSLTENPNLYAKGHSGHLNVAAALALGAANRGIDINIDPNLRPNNLPTPAPTVIATPVPTVSPTVISTPVPTVSPTVISTPVPTVSPTVISTPVPTVSPTVISTPVPTVSPTVIATPVPTVSPTVISTPVPTVSPTVISTPVPTVSPTVISTPVPTVSPTVIATPVPTASPTVIATPVPTVSPTVISTPVPTVSPTVISTPVPTVSPTVISTPVPTVPITNISASATNVILPNTSSSREITITSNEEWIASSSDSWLAVSPRTGSGNGTITITVPQNWDTVFNRSATITLTSAGQNITINVTQDIFNVPLGATVSRTPFSWHFLTAPADTSWTATSDSPWITISPSSGTGNERIIMTVMENTTQSYRRGRVTISTEGRDRYYMVTQSYEELTLRNPGTGARPVP